MTFGWAQFQLTRHGQQRSLRLGSGDERQNMVKQFKVRIWIWSETAGDLTS